MDVQQLADIEAIKQLKARYLRLQDQRRWDEWSALFTDDATIHCMYPGMDPIEWHGRDEIVHGNRELNTDVRGVHHGHTPEIQLTSATTATATWALMDVYFLPGGRAETFGYYEDEYVKGNGGWRIQSVRLELE